MGDKKEKKMDLVEVPLFGGRQILLIEKEEDEPIEKAISRHLEKYPIRGVKSG